MSSPGCLPVGGYLGPMEAAMRSTNELRAALTRAGRPDLARELAVAAGGQVPTDPEGILRMVRRNLAEGVGGTGTTIAAINYAVKMLPGGQAKVLLGAKKDLERGSATVTKWLKQFHSR